jgi:endonuclease III
VDLNTEVKDEAATYAMEIASALRIRYRNFNHNNPKNPLSNLLFIICSVQTTKINYELVYRQLRRSFPTFMSLHLANESQIAKVLRPAGLANQKSSSIKRILQIIHDRNGRLTLSPLKYKSNAECEQFLTSLPGVGKKVARCVMMSTLGRQVFPVDTHCWRICNRLGWISSQRSDNVCSPQEMDLLQAKIPRRLRFTLHVNMISLGREFCLPKSPRCSECPIRAFCNRKGL